MVNRMFVPFLSYVADFRKCVTAIINLFQNTKFQNRRLQHALGFRPAGAEYQR